MPLEDCGDGRQVFGGLERIEVVGLFTERNSSGAQLPPSRLIANSDTAPIVALKQHNRPGEMVALAGEEVSDVLPQPRESHCSISRVVMKEDELQKNDSDDLTVR